MSTRLIAALLLLLLVFFDARSAIADEPLSGQGLLALCSTPDATEASTQQPDQAAGFGDECLAVIRNAKRMMHALKDDGNCFADIPEAAADDDLARTAVQYFTAHPALMKRAASYALFNAMAAAYPCPE
jgi:hypothetical protein